MWPRAGGVVDWPLAANGGAAVWGRRPTLIFDAPKGERVFGGEVAPPRAMTEPQLARQVIGPLVTVARELTQIGVPHRGIRPGNLFYQIEQPGSDDARRVLQHAAGLRATGALRDRRVRDRRSVRPRPRPQCRRSLCAGRAHPAAPRRPRPDGGHVGRGDHLRQDQRRLVCGAGGPGEALHVDGGNPARPAQRQGRRSLDPAAPRCLDDRSALHADHALSAAARLAADPLRRHRPHEQAGAGSCHGAPLAGVHEAGGQQRLRQLDEAQLQRRQGRRRDEPADGVGRQRPGRAPPSRTAICRGSSSG